MDKTDYLHVCNNMGVPLEDFHQQFCSRCLQPECSRSQAGKSLFEDRVQNWHERLFENPSKMDPKDPRYQAISAVKFIDIAPSLEVRSPAQSSWVDPRDIEPPEPAPAPLPTPAPAPETIESEPEPQKVQEPEPVLEKPPEPAPAPQPAPKPETVRRGPLQTPFQQGQMLSGETPQKNQPPPKDSWAGPLEKTSDGVKVVKPGAKIRFGS